MKSNLELELENARLRSELNFLLGYIRCAARENYNIIPKESVYLKERIESALGGAEKPAELPTPA